MRKYNIIAFKDFSSTFLYWHFFISNKANGLYNKIKKNKIKSISLYRQNRQV
jgi:hypothetical protein